MLPKFALTHPPFLVEEFGEDPDPETAAWIGVDGSGENWEISCFSLNLASWINGLETLFGGDPLKNGGDEATWVLGL